MSGIRIKALLDTNVWVSGYIFNGNERKVIAEAIEGHYQSIISIQILNEFRKVMLQKFKLPEEDVLQAVNQIIQMSEIVNVDASIPVKVRDENDIHIIRTAVGAECNYLVTGDKDIKILGSILNTVIISPAMFLKKLRNG